MSKVPDESAIVIKVPQAESVVGAFRSSLDPSAAWGMPAHVTLLYPFVSPAAIDEYVIQKLAKVMSMYEPFMVEFSHVKWFGEQVLWLAPQPDSAFRSLMTALFDAFPECLPYGGSIEDPTPHLTVADGASMERMREVESILCAELPIHASFDAVSVMVGSQQQGTWTTIAELPFRRAANAH